MEKILAFQIKEGEMQKLKQIVNRMKIHLIAVEKEVYRQTLADLLEQKVNPLLPAYDGDPLAESMIVMDGFTEKRFDILLQAIQNKTVQIDYKAVINTL